MNLKNDKEPKTIQQGEKEKEDLISWLGHVGESNSCHQKHPKAGSCSKFQS